MRAVRLATYGTLAVIAVMLLLPGVSPVQLSYVTSDSMEPAIMEGDGYLIHKTSDVTEGDVVTFRSTEQQGLVTHRIVEERPEGFITKGDNNPSRDQTAGMPPVDRDAVVGTVVEFRGTPLTIPGMGVATAWLADNRLGVMAVIAVLVVLSLAFGAGGSSVTRDVVYVKDVAVPLFLGAVIVSAALMVVGTTTQDLTYVATTGGSPAPHTVAVGEPTTQRVDVDVRASPLTTAVVALHGVERVNASVSGSSRTLWVRVPPQEETGVYSAQVTVHPYPAALPGDWLDRLHGVHPIAAMTASIVTVFGPLLGLYTLLLDGRSVLRAPRWRWIRRFVEGKS